MTTELIVIVPTRSRPMHVQRVVQAWRDTGAFDEGAQLHFVIDADDPDYEAYELELLRAREIPLDISYSVLGAWKPLVPKLNTAAADLLHWHPYALGFAGDDHLPRTRGWVRAYTGALRGGAGIVYGDDGYQHENLPTEWAMRASIVRALGRMVPAPVEHLYCDNAVRDLGRAAGCLRYLPEVKIEHLNPYADGKAPMDEQYERVNSRAQYATDRPAYRAWQRAGLPGDAAIVIDALKGETRL